MQILPTQGSTANLLPSNYAGLMKLTGTGFDLFANILKLNAQASGTNGKLASVNAGQGTGSANDQVWKNAQTLAAFAQSGMLGQGQNGVVSSSSWAKSSTGVAGSQAEQTLSQNSVNQTGTDLASSVSAAMAKLASPAMPRTRGDTSLLGVKMTKDDFSALSDKLSKAGVSQDKIDEWANKIQSSEGMTWSQFTNAVHQAVLSNYFKTEPASDADKSQVSSLMDRLGFDSKQTSALADALSNGKGGRAFEIVSGQLRSLDPNQTITISASEMNALANTLKLPDSSKQNLLSLFGKQESVTLTPQGMVQALTAVKKEVSGQLSQAKDALAQVKDQIDPVMDKALERIGFDQQVMNSKVASSQVKPSSLLQEPASVQPKVVEVSKEAQQKETQLGKAGETVKGGDGVTPKPDGSGHGQDSGAVQKDGRQPGSQFSGKEKDASQNGKDTPDKSWNDFLGKIRAEDGTSTADARAISGLGTAAQVPGQTQQVTPQTVAQGGSSQSNGFLDQVESGILKNLGQGTKQLSLELTPESLGRLNVVLTVKGKEVQAVIKPETPEAEKVLSENLSQLKKSLEDQGLTVSKMEVRTGVSQDSNLGQQWAGGADKHNLSQERRDALDRMRTNSLLAGVGDGLARQMQNTGAQVKISQGGLDIVA